MTPRFLALDGIDGTGKSTQVQLLAEWLRALGQPVTTCVDPGGTSLGARLRTLLLDHRESMTVWTEAFLFMASRSELVAQLIRPALDRGDWVLSDRYLLANVVYQGYAGGLDPAALWQVGQYATAGILPAVTFVLDLPVQQALARRGRDPDRLEARDQAFHERVRQGFLTVAAQEPQRYQVVDASGDIATIQADLRQRVELLCSASGKHARENRT